MARPKEIQLQEEAKKVVSENLKRFLASRNLSQIELSERLGIPKQTLNGYVKGTSLPTPGNTEKIAQFFNVSKGDIDPRFKATLLQDYNLNEALRKLNDKESEFFEALLEKTLSLGEEERKNFLENVRFAVEFFNKKDK